MTVVFISGSIGIKRLDSNVKSRIDNVIKSGFEIILGDADGVDSSIQKYLADNKVNSVTIYCSGSSPRNNIGNWSVKRVKSKHKEGTRAFYTAKDLQLAEDSDYGLMIWDSKSTGTLNNTIELLLRDKKSLVYINKAKEFLKIVDVKSLEALVNYMNEVSINKADKKIDLKNKIDSLRFKQNSLSLV